MTLLGYLAVLAVVGKAQARVHDERKLVPWAPAVDGECNFVEDYNQWVIHPGGYNPDCDCGYFNKYFYDQTNVLYKEPPCPPPETGYAYCAPRLCAWQDDDLDVVTASAPAHVNSSVTFLDIAQYILGYEKETTLCFPAKGYQIAQDTINEGQEDEATVVTIHGHVLIGIDEVEPLPDDIKNLRIPGSYWMEGGTLSLQAAGCIDIGAGLKECPFNLATKAEGKFYDICYEMAKARNIEYETHCDLINRLDCNNVNTCEWDADNSHCQYNPVKRLTTKAGKRQLKH